MNPNNGAALKKHATTELENTASSSLSTSIVDFRHLDIFRQVYLEASYTNAGYELHSSRRSVMKTVRDLEEVFGGDLFKEGGDGKLGPTPFGERLFNDFKPLRTAMNRLQDKIETIRVHDRVLRVGASPTIFRTTLFRKLYRELRAMPDFRISYVPVPGSQASKGLSSGYFDWHLCCGSERSDRYVSETISEIPIRTYRRGLPDHVGTGTCYTLKIDEITPVAVAFAGQDRQPAPHNLSEEKWLRWLDYPAECEIGTLIRAPEIAVDRQFWSETFDDDHPGPPLSLYAIHLRQHPYEFLPNLAERLRNRCSTP